MTNYPYMAPVQLAISVPENLELSKGLWQMLLSSFTAGATGG